MFAYCPQPEGWGYEIAIVFDFRKKSIEELGGEMPENLPVADSIKKIENANEPKQLKPRKKYNDEQ